MWKVGIPSESVPDVIVHDESVTSVTFGPNPERKILAATSVNRVKLWRLENDTSTETGKVSHKLLPNKTAGLG